MEKEERINANNEAIRKCIKSHKCTITDLAAAAGVTKSTISQWFYGDMSLTRAQTIAEYLGVSLSVLLGEASEEGEIIEYKGKRYKIIELDE